MIEKGTLIENEVREKITNVENENGIKLSTTQKILLCIRGPITNILDVLYGEVNLFMLDQHFERASPEIAGLISIAPGDEVDFREVIVHKNGRPLVYAKSYIPTSRCNEEILEDLKAEKLTTGKIIDKHAQETLRIINRISIENPNGTLRELFKTDDKMLSREYTIKHDNKIIIWTKESYPISYFQK